MADEQNTGSNLFSYIGEEELKHFLDWMVRLGNKKYMPIDGVPGRAQSAATADRLSSSVSINGQMFDGTQNITFDEYAKKDDIIKKTDLSEIGSGNNGNKILVLDSKGKINNEYLDTQEFQKSIDDSVQQLSLRLDAHQQNNEESFSDVNARIYNSKTELEEQINNEIGLINEDINEVSVACDNVKRLVYMSQIKASVKEGAFPAYIELSGLDFKDHCTAPIEVLKDTGSRTISMNFKTLGYGHYENSNIFSVSSNSIEPLTVKEALCIKESYYEDKNITEENQDQRKEIWLEPKTFTEGEKTWNIWLTRFIYPEMLEDNNFKLHLCTPESNFYYGAIVDSDVYIIKNEKLEKDISLSDVPDSQENKYVTESLKRGSANTLVTDKMIEDLNIPKGEALTILLVTSSGESLKPFDISYSHVSRSGYVAEPKMPYSYYDMASICGFSVQSECSADSNISFAIKIFNENAEVEYAVWDFSEKQWTNKSLDDIKKSSPSISRFANVPPSAWESVKKPFLPIFILFPKTPDSVCKIGTSELFYNSKFGLTKASHGVDYTYSYSGNSLLLSFNKAGEYLVNFYATDTIQGQNRTITTITAKNQEILNS